MANGIPTGDGQISVGDLGGSSDGGGGTSAGDVSVGDINIQEPTNVQTDDGGDGGGDLSGVAGGGGIPTSGGETIDPVTGEESGGDTGGDGGGDSTVPSGGSAGAGPGGQVDVDTGDSGGGDTSGGGGDATGPAPGESGVAGAPRTQQPDTTTQDPTQAETQPIGQPVDRDEFSPGTQERIQTQEQAFARETAEDFSRQVPGDVAPSDVRTELRRTDSGLVFTQELTDTAAADVEGRLTARSQQTAGAFAFGIGSTAVDPETRQARFESTQPLTPEEIVDRGVEQDVVDVNLDGEPTIEGETPFGQATAAPGTTQLPSTEETGGGPISGPPGQLEQRVTSPFQFAFGPPGELEQNARQRVVGPPGTVESAAGDVAFGIRDVSREAADVATEEVVEPGAELFGEAIESVPLQPTVPVGFGTMATAEEVAGAEERGAGPETGVGTGAELFSRGIGVGATEATLGLPAGAVEAGALGAEAGEFTAAEIEQQGLVEGSGEALEAGGQFAATGARTVSQFAQENPALFAGTVGGAAVTAFGAGRAIQSAPAVARDVSIRARGGRVFSEAELADQPATTMGGLPAFSGEARASSLAAAREFRSQAATGALAEELGAPTAFSVRGARATREFGGFGRQFEAPAQDIGLSVARTDPQGQFFSADISRLRLPGDSGTSRPTIGLPRPRLRAGEVAAEVDPDIGIIQSQDLGSAFEFMSGRRAGRAARAAARGEDVDVSDIDFTTGPASRQQSFVRGATLTPEQEAIAPPGSAFTATGDVFGVRIGGEVVRGRVFSRGAGDVDVEADEAVDVADISGDVTRASETARVATQEQPQFPVVPTAPANLPATGEGVTRPPPSNQTEAPTAAPTPTDGQPPSSVFRTPGESTPSVPGGGPTVTPTPGEATASPAPTVSEPIPTGTSGAQGTGGGTAATSGRQSGGGDATGLFTGSPTEAGTQPSGPVSGGGGSGPDVGPGVIFEFPATQPSTPPSEPNRGEPSNPFGPSRGPPSQPPSEGAPPISPPRSPPSRPPGQGPPSGGGPPTTPFTPGGGGGGPPQRPLTGGIDASDRDEEEEVIAPTGTEFENPIATGAQLLGFGVGGDGGDGETGDTADTSDSPFGPFQF